MDADASLQHQINDTDDRLDQVGAMSAAFSALVPNSRSAGDTQLSVGAGYYSSEGAIAAGLFHHVNPNVLINAGISTSIGDFETAGRVGITWGW